MAKYLIEHKIFEGTGNQIFACIGFTVCLSYFLNITDLIYNFPYKLKYFSGLCVHTCVHIHANIYLCTHAIFLKQVI